MHTSDISNITNSGNIIMSTLEKFFPYWGLEGKALDAYIEDINIEHTEDGESEADKPSEVKVFEILNAKNSIKKIKNIQKILGMASSYLSEETINHASYTENEEWYDKFIEGAGQISDEEAQIIWAKILAKEIDKKGSTPRGIFRILSEMDTVIAKGFNELCKHHLLFVALDNDNNIVTQFNELIVVDDDDSYYEKKGINLEILNELKSLGLISESLGLYKKFPLADRVLISDGKNTECLNMKGDKHLLFGRIMFTQAGRYLCSICNPEIEYSHLAVVKKYLCNHGYKFEETNNYQITIQENSFAIKGLVPKKRNTTK